MPCVARRLRGASLARVSGRRNDKGDRSLAGLAARLRAKDDIAAAAEPGEDTRTLVVDHDSHGYRWKDFREVAAEMKAHTFLD